MADQAKSKILLIDDDTSLLVTLRDFLSFEGYDVTTADSGELGLERLKALTPDLIILDMSMPGMGGVGFLNAVSSKEGRPKYPVLVLTARANMAEFFADVEVEGFIAKPCSPEDLLMVVARIIFLRRGPEASSAQLEEDTNRSVLIGEDEPEVLEILTESFRRAGFDVESVVRGPDVLERAVMMRPCAVVMKRVFTGMNGDVVASVLREMPNTKKIPIVLYDHGNETTPETKYLSQSAGVKIFLRTHAAPDVVAAVKRLVS